MCLKWFGKLSEWRNCRPPPNRDISHFLLSCELRLLQSRLCGFLLALWDQPDQAKVESASHSPANLFHLGSLLQSRTSSAFSSPLLWTMGSSSELREGDGFSQQLLNDHCCFCLLSPKHIPSLFYRYMLPPFYQIFSSQCAILQDT